MDGTDLKILRCLQEKPEISMIDLAGLVGLSHTPCWRRVKMLQASGVIKERAIIICPDLMGFGISVLAALRLKAHDEETLNALERSACALSEVVDCFSTSGENDYLLRVVARSVADYEQFLKKVLLHLPGVASVNSTFTLRHVKRTTRLPI